MEIQSVMLGIFDPSCELAPLYLLKSSPPLPRPPCVNKYQIYTVCNTGGGGGVRVVWRASTGLIHCVFDQIPNLQNCFTTPNKNQEGIGPQTKKHMPTSTFTSKFLRKADI